MLDCPPCIFKHAAAALGTTTTPHAIGNDDLVAERLEESNGCSSNARLVVGREAIRQEKNCRTVDPRVMPHPGLQGPIKPGETSTRSHAHDTLDQS